MAGFLLIDTSGTIATVAWVANGEVLAQEQSSDQRQQAAVINLMIEDVLHQAQRTLAEVSAYGICEGPGSYTGLRVGMSTVKGMAFALSQPMICTNRFQLIVWSHEQASVVNKRRAVLLYARKGEYFWALFDDKNEALEAPRHIYEDELASILKPEDLLLTDVSSLPFHHQNSYLLPDDFTPDVAKWGVSVQRKWERKEFSDIAYTEPLYLKPAFTTTPKKTYHD